MKSDDIRVTLFERLFAKSPRMWVKYLLKHSIIEEIVEVSRESDLPKVRDMFIWSVSPKPEAGSYTLILLRTPDE